MTLVIYEEKVVIKKFPYGILGIYSAVLTDVSLAGIQFLKPLSTNPEAHV
jgi:hypothetical protein